jgi:hypothetical protein
MHFVLVIAARGFLPRVLHVNLHIVAPLDHDAGGPELEIGFGNFHHTLGRGIRGLGGCDLDKFFQPRNRATALGAPQQIQELVPDQLAAAIGEDGRSIDQGGTVLMVAPGRKSSDATAVWQHGEANLGATALCGVRRTARQEDELMNNEAREV